MKKLGVTLISLLMVLAFAWMGPFYAANDDTVTALGGTYRATENVVTETLEQGIIHTKAKGESSSQILIGGTGSIDPQVVNVLSVPSNPMVRTVNWTYSNQSGWTKQTISNIAKDFERNNPGWIVLAGVNGDFFDINGNGPLPYQTSGYCVSDGEVYRPYTGGISTSSIGFTNNGTANSMVVNKEMEVTGHKLEIYNDFGEVIKTFDIDLLNQQPTGSQIAVYFSYPKDDQTTEYITVPQKNSYTIENPIRCLAMTSEHVYGKGSISMVETQKRLFLGQFSIVTDNAEVQRYLSIGASIRVQQHIVGPYANCDNILGCGAVLVENGVPHRDADGMSDYRHPRTCIGKKADGTLMLFTVDGRQPADNMYGMTYEELSAMMLYYDCIEGYNVDGGGSTTMIIRNAEGLFDVVNSPSDNSERRDSNAVLIVVPSLTLEVAKTTDTTVQFARGKSIKGVSVSDIHITLNGQTKPMTEEVMNWDQLNPKTEYQIAFSYKISYKGNTISKNGKSSKFKTGRNAPKITNFYYEETDTRYTLYFNIEDTDQTITIVELNYGNKMVFVDATQTQFIIAKSQVSEPVFKLTIDYNLEGTASERELLTVVFEKKNEQKPGGCKCKKTDIRYLLLTFGMISLTVLGLRKK